MMFVDYNNLDKTCKKDPFGLPRIDQVVDTMADCNLLSFLDCYFGYLQIPLKEEDQIKTSLITPFGAFCYTTALRIKKRRCNLSTGYTMVSTFTT
jgi:hypothetical protein